MQSLRLFQPARRCRAAVLAWGVSVICANLLTAVATAGDNTPLMEELSLGRELFMREWLPNDSRARGGDGLGPVFNDTSCVACHNLGGTGGAGPASKNVDIVSAFSTPQQREAAGPLSLPGFVIGTLFGGSPRMRQKPAAKPDPKKDAEELAKIHPGFRSARSVVLHRFSTNDKYEPWRAGLEGSGVVFAGSVNVGSDGLERIGVDFSPQPAEGDPPQPEFTSGQRAEQLKQQVRMTAFRANSGAQSQHGNFTLLVSQRNTTALFGAGLIDSIPDKVLEAAAEAKQADFLKVSGRVTRLADGKIGRFGWKSQKASLREFAMTACAVELGLNVPEHEQAGVALKPDYKSPGLDMNAKDCDALVAFLKHLPAPAVRAPAADTPETKVIDSGKTLFTSVGCSACHTPKLGDVAGIYSDLLVHDMGPELGDTGNYGVFIPSPGDEGTPEPVPSITEAFGGSEQTPKDSKQKIIGATRLEWRTPPLWGFRDSGPYLHDGRAETLDQAVAFHGGEAVESTRRYFALSNEQRFQVTSFLKSLVAPE